MFTNVFHTIHSRVFSAAVAGAVTAAAFVADQENWRRIYGTNFTYHTVRSFSIAYIGISHMNVDFDAFDRNWIYWNKQATQKSKSILQLFKYIMVFGFENKDGYDKTGRYRLWLCTCVNVSWIYIYSLTFLWSKTL